MAVGLQIISKLGYMPNKNRRWLEYTYNIFTTIINKKISGSGALKGYLPDNYPMPNISGNILTICAKLRKL